MRLLSTMIPSMISLSNTRLKPKSRLTLLRKFAKQKEPNWHQSVLDFSRHGKLVVSKRGKLKEPVPLNRRRKRSKSD